MIPRVNSRTILEERYLSTQLFQTSLARLNRYIYAQVTWLTVIFSRFYKQPKLLNTCKTIRRFERGEKTNSPSISLSFLSLSLSVPSVD